jgi:hypothetical protein
MAFCISAASAQETMQLHGRVLSGGTPVAGQPVALHRVTSSGGETLDGDTTDTQGNFTVRLDRLDGSAVHFIATRYEGEFYIGDTFRDELPTQYLLRVGPGATPLDLTPAMPTASVAPSRETNAAGAVVVGLALLLLGGVIALAARRRRAPARQLLVEIADLDNRNELTPVPHYAQQRAHLLQRLRESA